MLGAVWSGKKVQSEAMLEYQVGGGPAMGTGADFLQLDPAAAPRRRMIDWLTARLRAAIADHRLPPGAFLPPSRVLAADLGVSRGVIVEAYRRLVEEGLAAGRPGAGTRVLGAGPAVAAAPRPATATPARCARPNRTPGHPGGCRCTPAATWS